MMIRVLKSISVMLLLGVVLAAAAWAQDDAKKLTIVELFTSEGCSSCPPADRFLGELAKRQDILALSWNVDYWDYLGWQDTLALPENTARQRAYNHALGKTGVYTPQMIIDGRHDVVGSRREDALAFIAKEAKKKWAVSVILAGSGDNRKVEVGAGTPKEPATVWLISYDRVRKVAIERGELAGQTMIYHDVVRSVENLGQWDGNPVSFNVDLYGLSADGRDAAAVLVQEGEAGPILGAARFDLTQPQ